VRWARSRRAYRPPVDPPDTGRHQRRRRAALAAPGTTDVTSVLLTASPLTKCDIVSQRQIRILRRAYTEMQTANSRCDRITSIQSLLIKSALLWNKAVSTKVRPERWIERLAIGAVAVAVLAAVLVVILGSTFSSSLCGSRTTATT
jgi:hypothetical protein